MRLIKIKERKVFKMKNIQHWKELKRSMAPDGRICVLYEFQGYKIRVAECDCFPGGYSFSAEPIDTSRRSYFPSLSIGEHHGAGYQSIEIQTTSWGALELTEIDKMLYAYKKAQIVAHEIEAEFPECFTK